MSTDAKGKENQLGIDLWSEPSALAHLKNMSLIAVRSANDGAFFLNRSSFCAMQFYRDYCFFYHTNAIHCMQYDMQ